MRDWYSVIRDVAIAAWFVVTVLGAYLVSINWAFLAGIDVRDWLFNLFLVSTIISTIDWFTSMVVLRLQPYRGRSRGQRREPPIVIYNIEEVHCTCCEVSSDSTPQDKQGD